MSEAMWAVGSEQRAVKARIAPVARPPRAWDRPLPTAHSFPGVTLIELLITMTIIAIISAAILGTASAAMEAGRRSRTDATIAKLNGLIMERWDSYAERRVDVNPTTILQPIDQLPAGAANAQQLAQLNVTRGQMLADARLLALRELIRMEMPDRWADVVNQNMQDNVPLNNPPTILAAVPAVTQTYRRRLYDLQQNPDNTLDEILDNQRAECLYMIVMFHTGDGEARTMFTSQDIGDTDGDGAPEFLDGWGNPIEWIRWPTGFVLQSSLMTGDADGDHDPFDVFRRDSASVVSPPEPQPSQYPPPMIDEMTRMRNRNARAAPLQPQDRQVLPFPMLAFRLVPLIYSSGPDESSDYRLSQEVGGNDAWMPLDPYFENQEDGLQSGAPNPDGEGWKDNIHNHLIEY